MSRRREHQRHQRQLDEIKNIMSAMKNLAFLETHKLAQRLDNQQQMVSEIEQAAFDFLDYYPYSYAGDSGAATLWVLFGSERGFCGDFNETLLKCLNDYLPSTSTGQNLLVPVGCKLSRRLDDDQRVASEVAGPGVAEEVTAVLTSLVREISQLQTQYTRQGQPLNVSALYHNMQTRRVENYSLLPPFQQRPANGHSYTHPAVLNLTPAFFFAELVEHYLFIALHEIAYMSLMAENHQRIQHMEGAVRYLDKTTQQLMHQYHRLRQEEITEEIEVILLNAVELIDTLNYSQPSPSKKLSL